MDKNTVIGFILIFVMIFGFNWLNRPSEEQLAEQQRMRDSIAAVNEAARIEAIEMAAKEEERLKQDFADDTDSTQLIARYGEFAYVATGQEEFYTVETELLKLVFTNKGGRIYSAELKDYKTYDQKPLILFEGDESTLDFTLQTVNNRVLNTSSLYFVTDVFTAEDSTVIVTMTLPVGENSSLDFIYTLPKDNYMIDFTIQANNMQKYLNASLNSLDMKWMSTIRQQEKGRKFEDRYATLNFKYTTDDMEKLSESKNQTEKPVGRIKWIAYKDQFFSTIMIAKNDFTQAQFESTLENENTPFLKRYNTNANIFFDATGREPSEFNIYLGPNQYNILASYDDDVAKSERLQLKKIIPLGWSLFRYISEWLIIPVFLFLCKYMTSYGLIILVLTLIIKLIIFPFTFKSYMSTAKMRVLKPQIDEINAKIPADKAMERQQATMNLYRKVGVSPMSGCIPMLFQMPVLFAMFSFFPTAIELRQQSFLWATDLSSYDAIVSWSTYIPLITPYFGNHISLFCLLMTVTNIIYTKVNMANQATNQAMPGMNMIMYLMPLMFLFIFNNYASGLTYYYFLSILITIGQTYGMRLFVNEEKLLKELESRKGKPKKKSSFMERLEKMQREQSQQMQQAKKGKK